MKNFKEFKQEKNIINLNENYEFRSLRNGFKGDVFIDTGGMIEKTDTMNINIQLFAGGSTTGSAYKEIAMPESFKKVMDDYKKLNNIKQQMAIEISNVVNKKLKQFDNELIKEIDKIVSKY